MDGRDSGRTGWTGGRWAVALLVVLAFAATGISLMLTSYHLTQGKEPWGLFSLACGEEGGCADVLASPWAVGPGGIPVAVFGAVYFGALGLWYLAVGRPNRPGSRWQALPLVLNLLGALVSILLLSIMLLGLQAVCWWCTLTHLINFALLFLGWKVYQAARAGAADAGVPARPSGRHAFAGILLMAAWAVICVQGVSVAAHRKAAERANEYARTFYEDVEIQALLLQRKQPRVEIPIRPDDPVRGNPAAPHTAVVFSDFQCPACRGFAQFFEGQVLPEVGDRLKIVYKHFPLEPECNPALTQAVHAHACEAAEAAEAARSLGGSEAFWKMHDRLFQVQDSLGQTPWANHAAAVGLDSARFGELMAANAFRDRIREDAGIGVRSDVQSTPTVFLDGRKLEDWQRIDLWKALAR